MTQHPKEPREPDHWMYAQTLEEEEVRRNIIKRFIDAAEFGYPVSHALLRDAEDAIATTPSRIPNGFVLVPKVPTEAMCEAGWREMPDSIAEAWAAMIAAAPQAPALPETGVGNG